VTNLIKSGKRKAESGNVNKDAPSFLKKADKTESEKTGRAGAQPYHILRVLVVQIGNQTKLNRNQTKK
jgi:hypothetical protein